MNIKTDIDDYKKWYDIEVKVEFEKYPKANVYHVYFNDKLVGMPKTVKELNDLFWSIRFILSFAQCHFVRRAIMTLYGVNNT